MPKVSVLSITRLLKQTEKSSIKSTQSNAPSIFEDEVSIVSVFHNFGAFSFAQAFKA